MKRKLHRSAHSRLIWHPITPATHPAFRLRTAGFFLACLFASRLSPNYLHGQQNSEAVRETWQMTAQSRFRNQKTGGLGMGIQRPKTHRPTVSITSKSKSNSQIRCCLPAPSVTYRAVNKLPFKDGVTKRISVLKPSPEALKTRQSANAHELDASPSGNVATLPTRVHRFPAGRSNRSENHLSSPVTPRRLPYWLAASEIAPWERKARLPGSFHIEGARASTESLSPCQ